MSACCVGQIINLLFKSRIAPFILKKIIALLCLLLLSASAAFALWATRPIADTMHEFTIRPGSGLRSSAQQIAAAGVPLPPLLFELLARVKGQGGQLKAGTFDADAQITPLELLSKIVRGEYAQFSFALIEGWTFKQMRAAILHSPNLRHDTAELSDGAILSRLGSIYAQPEGLFFPDTYLLPKGSSDMDLYQHAYHQLQVRLDAIWQQRDPKLSVVKTPYEALILASLIEKETGLRSDRSMIAGVFVNRLRIGMLLQTDPSVIYGMGELYQGKIHRSDLLKDSPYNTYTRPGLPPTPIALVGRESLLAALSPAPTDALYFVARGDGSSQFSTTLLDHHSAVNHYLKRSPR